MKNKSKAKKYIKDEYQYIRNSKRLMRANKLAANPIFIISVCLFLSFIMFHLINYIFVCIPNLINYFYGETVSFSIFNAFNYNNITKVPLLYFATFILLLIFNARLIYLFRVSFKSFNVGQKGTSRWTTLDEIKEQYIEIHETGDRNSIDGSGGIPVSRINNKLYIDTSAVNNLIIGITRSGKGEMLVFPMIDIYSRATNPASLVITDPKLELFASSYQTLIDRGYEVHLLNLVEPLKSSGYNPLALIIEAYTKGEYTIAEMLCNTFVSSIFKSASEDDTNQFFSNASMGVTSALILAIIEEKQEINKIHEVTMSNIVAKFTELASAKVGNTDKTLLDEYFEKLPNGNKAKLKYAVVNMGSAKTKGNVYSHVMSKLTIFTYTEIATMTSTNEINLHSIGFGSKPQAVFIGIPDYDTSNHYLASIFLSQLQFTLSKAASLTENGKCENEVVFILDEFGNLPAIADMENTITVCLGRNIKYNLIIQSYSQIEKLYGKSSETIIGNCGNQIFIQTNDKSTAEHFSALIGSETITNLSRAGEKFKLNKNITESYDERPLLNPNELQGLKTGEMVVKRVMTRKNKKGEDITPYPIFNTGISKFKYRYEYLIAYFPSKSIISLNIEEKKIPTQDEQTKEKIYLNELEFKDNIISKFKQYNIAKSDFETMTIIECNEIVVTAEKYRIITYVQMNELLSFLKGGT